MVVARSPYQPYPHPHPRGLLPQVLGLVGSSRKRVLLLWQAVELAKFLGFPNARTLEVARWVAQSVGRMGLSALVT